MKTDDKDCDPGKVSLCSHADDTVLYVTGELSDVDRTEFEAHMEQCASCRAGVAELGDIVGRLQTLGRTETPVCDVTAAVLTRIPERAWRRTGEAPRRQAVIAWPVFLRAAAGLLILLGCSLLILNLPSKQTDNVKSPGDNEILKPEAIECALAWLVSVQDPSGAWDPAVWGGEKEFKVALTSLALLGLVEEEKHADPDRIKAVQMGTSFICDQQTEDGSFGSESEGRMYNHGIAAVALLKAYDATGNEALRKPIADGLAFIQSQQLAGGGWGYGSHPTEQANTSISVWQIQALLSAQDMGFAVEGSGVDKGLNWLKSVIDPKGYFGYHAPLDSSEDADTLTAMGAYCLFTSGRNVAGSESLRMTIRGALKEAALRAEEDLDFYRWYFLAHALNAETRTDFAPILTRLQDSLVARREHAESYNGTWAPDDRWGSVGGRIYSTSMATLCLAVNDGPVPAM
jgi:hypothetical protein